jgi:hypothetical protein
MKPARLAIALLLLVAAAGADAKPSNKWRIKCNSTAKATGEVVLSIEPEGGTPIEVVIEIPAGTSENSAAVFIRDALSKRLKETHKVERDDWEDVLVKKRYGEPDFDLILEDNTVEGLDLKLREE